MPTIRHPMLAVLCLAMSAVAFGLSLVWLWLPGLIGAGLLFGYNALALAKWSLRPEDRCAAGGTTPPSAMTTDEVTRPHRDPFIETKR